MIVDTFFFFFFFGGGGGGVLNQILSIKSFQLLETLMFSCQKTQPEFSVLSENNLIHNKSAHSFGPKNKNLNSNT
jgi:hypothetical protein